MLFLKEYRGLLEGISKELVGLSDLDSNKKKVFEENKTVVTKPSLKTIEVVVLCKK